MNHGFENRPGLKLTPSVTFAKDQLPLFGGEFTYFGPVAAYWGILVLTNPPVSAILKV